MTASDSAALAQEYAPDLVAADATERAITVDQSNRSVIVGERVVVKWLTPPQRVPHPGVMLLRHLTEVGFTEMPAFLGAHVEGDHVVAMLTEFVPGALDGWDWYVDDLAAAIESGDTGPTMATARRIGALAARLHSALATPSSALPAPVGQGTLAAELGRAERLLAEALAETAGLPGERLAARAHRMRAVLGALDPGRVVETQPIHGDLHVGQLLRSGETIVVNDFDGNPIAGPGDDAVRRSPLVDLASLLQSIDHVGRIVQKRKPADHDAIELWIAVAVAAALDAYEQELADGRHPLAADDAPVLFALRAVQELHEFLYAARSLPVWLYVPDGSLTAMFPEH